MPLLSPVITSILLGNLSGNGILGISAPLLANGISLGFVQSTLLGVTVNTKDVGSAGAGIGAGVGVFLTPPILAASMQSTFTANGINGTMRNSLISAIANSISQALIAALLTTAHAGVGVGTGIATLVPNSSISVPNMIFGFTSSGIIGISARPLAIAVALGIDQALPSATAQVVIAGAAGPSPGTGVGVGKIL